MSIVCVVCDQYVSSVRVLCYYDSTSVTLGRAYCVIVW